MGQDISLLTSAYDFYPLTEEQNNQEFCFIDRSSAIGLLPILCFRYYDLKIMITGDQDDSRNVFMPELRYIVPLELAIKQMLAGVEVLKSRFPQARILDRYVDFFVEFIKSEKNKYLHMRFMDFAHFMDFDLLMHHCLMGIQYPTMKMYYSNEQIKQWNHWEKPAANGIMTWSGALRRLTRLGCCWSSQNVDLEELFTPSDLQDEPDICIMGFSTGSPV